MTLLTPKQYKKLYKKLELANSEVKTLDFNSQNTLSDDTFANAVLCDWKVNFLKQNSGFSMYLTLEEKSSIESDIIAQKPIWVWESAEAYKKFLKSIFSGKTIEFPYLADYNDSTLVVSKLSELFGKTVRLPNQDEALMSLKDNNHLTGFRDAGNGAVGNVGRCGYAWISD